MNTLEAQLADMTPPQIARAITIRERETWIASVHAYATGCVCEAIGAAEALIALRRATEQLENN